MLPGVAEELSSASASPTPAKASGSKVAIAAMRVLIVRPPVPIHVARAFVVCLPRSGTWPRRRTLGRALRPSLTSVKNKTRPSSVILAQGSYWPARNNQGAMPETSGPCAAHTADDNNRGPRWRVLSELGPECPRLDGRL